MTPCRGAPAGVGGVKRGDVKYNPTVWCCGESRQDVVVFVVVVLRSASSSELFPDFLQDECGIPTASWVI